MNCLQLLIISFDRFCKETFMLFFSTFLNTPGTALKKLEPCLGELDGYHCLGDFEKTKAEYKRQSRYDGVRIEHGLKR